MARRFVSHARGRDSNRRQTLWIGGPAQTAKAALAASTSQLYGVLNAAALALRPFTVVRVQGSLFVLSDQVTASEQPFGAVGISVVTDQASAIGITAVPTPMTDLGSDSFFLHRAFGVDFQSTAASTAAANVNGWEFETTSKAMRKVPDGFDLAITIENAAVIGMDFIWTFRMLVKLH